MDGRIQTSGGPCASKISWVVQPLMLVASITMDYIAGKNSVLEALRTGRRKIFSVLIGRNASDLLVKEIVALARQKKIPIHEIAAEQLVHKTGVQTHQGVAAEVSGFPYVDLSEIIAASRKNPEGSFVVLLDEVQDPQNVGALIRTAHLTGAKGMVLMKHRAATINATVLITSSCSSTDTSACSRSKFGQLHQSFEK